MTVLFLGSNKRVTAFEFDFYQDDAPVKLQKLVASAMQVTEPYSVRVLYGATDLAPFPRSIYVNQCKINEAKTATAWHGLKITLAATPCLPTLHATYFKQVDLWDHYVATGFELDKDV